MTRIPNGPYLIEYSPRLPTAMRMAVRLCRLITLPFVAVRSALDTYQSELRRKSDDFWIGPGK